MMSSLEKIEELLRKKGELSTRDISKELQISLQHAGRLFRTLQSYNTVSVVNRITNRGNREFLVKYLILKK